MVRKEASYSMPTLQIRRSQLKMFDDHVRKAIDAGLSIIGETGKEFVYYTMKCQHSIPVADMPQRMETFHTVLLGTFGFGSRIIEKFAAMRLYEELGLGFPERRDWTLVNYVENAKKMLEQPV